ncbi:coiled-coil domain-containing protein 186 [Sitodiplosis mosellana]|uniref:coiled-coil domain-containing protein 186 n=1 Tax=Sitodiplosis mosellana TaxID=263140 RepID=UPI0024442AAE|nr:coiled-coil domain-containing protein 186 [Sitodiplosis mosellana]
MSSENQNDGEQTNGGGKTDEVDGYQKLNEIEIVEQAKSEIDVAPSIELSLTQSQHDCENINEFTYEATETSIENDLLTENVRLKEALSKTKEQYGNIQGLLRHNEEVIEVQKKELSLLESEKNALRREYETGKKEKEQAVVRYVMLEKNIIDANAAKDLSARKLRDSQKEVEALTNRLKFVCGERDRAHKEMRDHIRENENLKYDLQTCETKLKWNQRNLTQEKALKLELEKKLNEATEQLNQLNEQRQHEIDTEKKCEREQGAQMIMLKHMIDEKDRNIAQLQKSLSDLRSEFTIIFEKNENLTKDLELEKEKSEAVQDKLHEMETSMTEKSRSYEDLQSKLELSESNLSNQRSENESMIKAINKLKYIEECYKEQSEEMATLRKKEDEFLALLKDLTEKCVLVENKLILANSKSSALMLDNERLNKEHKTKVKLVKDMEDELIKAKLKHNDEIKLFNRILADEKNHSETLRNQLDNVIGDLEASKNKHSQVVKELNRELTTLRKRSNESSPSADSGFGTDGEARRHTEQQSTSNVTPNDNQEPSKKALIDRIVKLQRQLAKQTEKIEFLENHCVALYNELKAKTS